MVWPFSQTVKRGSLLESARETIALLQEIGRLSTERGVASMSRLTQKDVVVAASGVSLVPVAALPTLLGRHNAAAVMATMAFDRDATGHGILLFERADALRLVDLLLQKPAGTAQTFGALESSALAETANIALNQMVGAVARHAEISVRTLPPETVFDVRPRLLALARPPALQDHAVLVETTFHEKASGVKGTMLLVFFVVAPKPSG